MTLALVSNDQRTEVPALIIDETRIDLLKRTVCKGATDDELDLFIQVCNRRRLDPFAKQIYAVKRKDKRAGRDVMTIQTSIDGFRTIAQRTGELDGQEVLWCGEDGIWKDVWLDAKYPSAAKVIVYRRGSSRGFPAVACWASYVQLYDGKPTKFWNDMPDVMIAKCAEALALRKAFPEDLSGLYITEEMDQAENGNGAEPKPAKTTLKDRITVKGPTLVEDVKEIFNGEIVNEWTDEDARLSQVAFDGACQAKKYSPDEADWILASAKKREAKLYADNTREFSEKLRESIDNGKWDNAIAAKRQKENGVS